MGDPDQPALGYMDMPSGSGNNSNIPMSKIASRKYTPSKARDRQTGGGELDDFPILPEFERYLLIPGPRNPAGHCEISPRRNPEPNPELIAAPAPEPIPEDSSELVDVKEQKFLMKWQRFLIHILIKPLIRYSIRLSTGLLTALPLLLVAFAIWAYAFGEPVDRIQKAVKELRKDRNEPRSWKLF